MMIPFICSRGLAPKSTIAAPALDAGVDLRPSQPRRLKHRCNGTGAGSQSASSPTRWPAARSASACHDGARTDAGASFAAAASASRLFIQSRPDMRILRPALKQLSLAGDHADAGPQVLNAGCSKTWWPASIPRSSSKSPSLVAVGALSGFWRASRHRRRRHPGAGVLRGLRLAGVPLRCGCRSASAPRLRSSSRPSITSLSRPLHQRRGRHGHPQALVGADRDRRFSPAASGPLCAGATVQDRVRDGAWSAAARLLLARDSWKLADDVPRGF